MDVNEYMSKSLEHMAKQTALLEAILNGINSINESGVGNVVHAQPAETKKVDVESAAKVPKQVQAVKTEKKVTVDDARAALKKYAAIEGNDAAMELLTSLGATSVSALAEKGPEALQQLIDKCEGKGE